MNKFIIYVILLYTFFTLPARGLANHNALVICETKSISGETVRLNTELYNYEDKQSIQLPQAVPGNRIIDIFSPSDKMENQYMIFSCTMLNSPKNKQNDGFYYTLVNNGIVIDVKFFPTHTDWQTIKIFPYKQEERWQFVVFEGKESENISLGRALVFELDNEKFLQNQSFEFPLPFAPDKICPLSDKGMYIAVKSDYITYPQFCIVDAVLKMSRPLILEDLPRECSIYDIQYFENQYLIILLSPLDKNEQNIKKSDVYVLDTKSGVCITEPMSLLGIGTGSSNDIICSNKGFWIVTESIEEGFGYLTFATWDPVNGWDKESEYAFSGIEHGWLISTQTEEDISAVAFGNRLEIVGKPFKKSWIGKIENNITFLKWLSKENLAIGSGGKLYLFNANDLSLKEWYTTNSGWVSNIFPTLSKNDEPTNPFPFSKILIEEVQLRENFAGKEIRAILLTETPTPSISWSVSFLSNPVRWLNWYQDIQFGKSLLCLGLIPSYQEKQDTSAWLSIEPFVSDETDKNIFLPFTKYVHVSLQEDITNPHKILWVWAKNIAETFLDTRDPRELKSLGELLSGAPFQFNHEEISEPLIQNPLPFFRIVVIEAKAIANGIISVKEFLDFVSDGGSALVLADFWPDGNPQLFNYWLSNMGVYYNPSQRADGIFGIDSENTLASCWKDFPIVGGGVLKCIPTTSVSFPLINPKEQELKQVAFLTRYYGFGKIALLSSRSPLASPNLTNPLNKVFALQLFQWLSQPGTGYRDSDGDGLHDLIEDRNRNSEVDIGETDPYKKDSDGDGIPDGWEDSNRDGIWDTNETDPTCEDSDGDTIWDGADVQPVPAYEKIIITRVEPAEAPAEGGNTIFIQGRNFSSDTRFWFGSRPSPSVRILSSELAMAITPEYTINKGGKTFVYGGRGQEQIDVSPKKTFLYTPKNEVTITISPLPQEETGKEKHQGIHFQILPPPKGILKRVFILVSSKNLNNPQTKIQSGEKNWNLDLKSIKDDWLLLKAEWKKAGPAYGSLTFELFTQQQENQEPFRCGFIKAWAETPYNGKFIVKIENNLSIE